MTRKTGDHLAAHFLLSFSIPSPPLRGEGQVVGDYLLTVAALCPNRMARDFSSTTGWLLIGLPFS